MAKAIFEIFRTGRHNGTGKEGRKFWTDEELKQIAQLYNEEIKSAPLVIGHPKDNKPKYGAVKKVICCKNSLFAEAEVQPDLIKKIKAGKFSGISSSFYNLKNIDNPIKGISYYLRHVGFLENGKQTPAVKDMLPPEMSVYNVCFSEQESDVCLFCEDDYINLNYSEILHQKTLYFQQVLDVDYETALQFSINKE